MKRSLAVIICLAVVVCICSVTIFAGASGIFKIGDVNGDGEINATDSLLVLQRSIKKIARFPIEEAGVDDGVIDSGFNGKTAYQSACENGFSGTIEQWLDSLSVKNGQGGAYVKDAYLDGSKFIVLELSDGSVINGGYAGDQLDSTKTYFVVTFKDSDGTVLKTQTVKQGGAATPPKAPTKPGCRFDSWGGDYDHISADTVFTAQYKQSSDATFTVDNVRATKGEQSVKVNIAVSNNPGILGMTLSVNYDESAMTLVGAANGEAVSDVLTMTKPGSFKNGCNFVWDGQEISQTDIKDGNIITLTFNIAENAKSGVYPVSVLYGEGNIVNGDLQPLTFVIENGSITVQ